MYSVKRLTPTSLAGVVDKIAFRLAQPTREAGVIWVFVKFIILVHTVILLAFLYLVNQVLRHKHPDLARLGIECATKNLDGFG